MEGSKLNVLNLDQTCYIIYLKIIIPIPLGHEVENLQMLPIDGTEDQFGQLI